MVEARFLVAPRMWNRILGKKKGGLFHQGAFCVRDVRVILQRGNIHSLSEKRFQNFVKKKIFFFKWYADGY